MRIDLNSSTQVQDVPPNWKAIALFHPETYSEPDRSSKIEIFEKLLMVESCSLFWKKAPS